MTRTKRLLATLAIVGLVGVPDAVLAMGGGSENDAGSRDSNDGSSASSGDQYIEAQRKVQAMDYDGAIPLLESVLREEPGNADALNYLGYSHRKLGDTTKALAYYLQALSNEPEHLGANEYLGELYLEMGNLPKAEERLSVLQRACSGCMEEAELAEKIEAFKAKSS